MAIPTMSQDKDFFDSIDRISKERNTDGFFDKKQFLQGLKKEIEVILIYPDDNHDTGMTPYSHRILSYGLENMGIPNQIYAFDKHSYNENLLKALKPGILKFKIFGLGTYFESLPDMIALSKRIKAIDPSNRFVILGGQGTTDKQARQYTLESGVDAINVGHADPFFKFMDSVHTEKHPNREILFSQAKGLLATLEQPNVAKGKFPEFEYFPLMGWKTKKKSGERGQVNIPHYLDCPNVCHFCSQMKTGKTNVVESIVARLTASEENVNALQFEGPTFEGKLIESFRKIRETIQAKQGFGPKSSIVMDSKQFQDKNYAETLALLDEFQTIKVHIGINSIDESIAKEVGRNNCGKPRTAEELEEEIKGVQKFIRESDIKDIKLDMLLTPFDTRETIEKIIFFYAEVITLQKNTGRNIWMFLSPLIPYPSTKLYKRHQDKIDFKTYDQLGSQRAYDPTLRQYDEKSFGTNFLRYFSAPFITASMKSLIRNDDFRENYLRFLALSMTYQYLQGKKKLEEMDIVFPEYKDDDGVVAIFNAVTTESIDLMNHPRRKDFFQKNPAKFFFPQIQLGNKFVKKTAEAE